MVLRRSRLCDFDQLGLFFLGIPPPRPANAGKHVSLCCNLVSLLPFLNPAPLQVNSKFLPAPRLSEPLFSFPRFLRLDKPKIFQKLVFGLTPAPPVFSARAVLPPRKKESICAFFLANSVWLSGLWGAPRTLKRFDCAYDNRLFFPATFPRFFFFEAFLCLTLP